MGKKELSHDELVKKDYVYLTEMNQRLKNMCEIYYISHSGVIYLKSLIPFIEKVAILNDNNSLKIYRGALCLPNKIFEFKKNTKKNNLVVVQTNNFIDHGQSDNSEISLRINIAVRHEEEYIKQEPAFINTKIIPEYYTRYFEIIDKIGMNVDRLDFIPFTDEMVDDIVSGKLVEISRPDVYIPITKQLLLDIKKGDSVWYTKLPYSNRHEPTFVEGDPEKAYIMLKNSNKFYTAYTMFACSEHRML